MIPQPHDRLVKWAFARLQTAEACLRGMLPTALSDRLDWSTLAAQPGSFVDPDLADSHSDLLYAVHVHGSEEREILLYLLFEHQSTPDRWMALRLPGYALRVQRRWLDDHASARLLPWVVPLVLYHGRQPWRAARDYADLLDLGGTDATGLRLPSFPYLLLDLSHTPEQDLRLDALGLLVTRLLRHAWDGDLWDRLPSWGPVLSQVLREQGLEALHAAFRYITEVSDQRPGPDVRRWIARSLGPEVEDSMKSWAQQEREEGRQEGRKEGQQEGLLESRREVLMLMLKRRFGAVSVELEARIRAMDVPQLDRWALALLDAHSLTDLPQS